MESEFVLRTDSKGKQGKIPIQDAAQLLLGAAELIPVFCAAVEEHLRNGHEVKTKSASYRLAPNGEALAAVPVIRITEGGISRLSPESIVDDNVAGR